MSTEREGGAAKSRKPAAKVGGEFGAVGGIVVVGGVLVAGVAAGVIACLRRRSRKMLEKPDGKPGENSSLEDKLAVPMSENVEESEPILEIANMEKLSVENFSPMDFELSAYEKCINRSKGDDSPRSHFSLSASCGTSASVSSDSDDFVEINQISFKEDGSVPLEETSGKASFNLTVGKEYECISGKELVEPNVEYEESVDSFDGLEDNEEVGGQKVNDCEESGHSSLVCEERFKAEKRVEFVSGYREDDEFCIKDDGLMHVEKFHVPIEGIDADDVSCGGRIVEIDVLKVSEFVKGDSCLDREGSDQMGDAKKETVLFNKEDLQENVGASEGLNCDKEECWQAVIGQGEGLTSVKEGCSEDAPRREGDSSVDFGHCDERAEVDMSEECVSPIQEVEQSQQEIVGTNQEVLFCKEEKFESNEGQCGEENTDSEESANHIENVDSQEEQCGTVVSREDFENLDDNGVISHCEEKFQHEELKFSEEASCHTEEEFECTEIDDSCCQHAAPHELSNAKEEVHLCKEEQPEQKTFESNVEQYLLQRANSEEKTEERESDLAHEVEQCEHGTVDSRGFEVLDYEGAFNHSNECDQQEEEFSDQNCSPIIDTTQKRESECVEAEVHDVQDGQGQISEAVDECVLPSNEKSIQEENFGLNVKQCSLEKMDIEDTAHKGERCQHGTVDFCCSEVSDCKGGSNNCKEVAQHGEIEDSEETLFPINEQSQQETLKHEELDCREVEVPDRQDGHKSEPDGASKEEDIVSNVEQCSQEKIDSEELNCISAVVHKGSHSDECGQQEEESLDQNCSPIIETAQNKELDCVEAEVHDVQDGQGQVSEAVNECMLPCKEQSIQEENFELTVKQCPQEKMDIEDDLKGCHLDTAHEGERCQHGTVDFWCSEGLNCKGGSDNSKVVEQHSELEASEETLFPINEQSQQETLKHEEFDCREVEVPVHQDGHKTEPDGASKEENNVSNVEQCSQEKIDSEEVNCIAAVVHKGEQCQLGTIDSGNFGGLHENASYENGSCHYGAVGSSELDDLNRDSHSEKGQFENERLNFKEDIQNEQFENENLKSKEDIENEQFENGSLNSKEVVELHIGLEEKLSLREENIKEPQEALEVSVMKVKCEENAVHSKEAGVDGDAHIFKEKCQEEAMDSNKSQSFVEDKFVNLELGKGTTCEYEESEFVEENMPTAQDEYKRETVNLVDIQDSVKRNESDQLEGVAIPGETYQDDTVYSEQSELSNNLHSDNESCVQEEGLGVQSLPSQKEEIVDSKETSDQESLNQCKQSQEKQIDAKDLGYSSSIVLELSSNEPDCIEAYEGSHEDPQTYNKPEVSDTNDSEYFYGNTLEKEMNHLETVDPVATKYYKEDQEVCPEKEEGNKENSSTLTDNLNDQNEANQHISTTTMSESCKFLGVLKEFKVDDESTDSKPVTPLESEPREVSNTNSTAEREKKGWDPLHSSEFVSNSEEGKSLQMKPQRPLYMRTRIIVPLFAALLAFLFAYKFGNKLETVYAT